MDYPSIPDYYQPELSDPVKALIQYGHPEYLETHKGEYLKLWVQLGLKYPLDYWNAFVDQTKGYWFPGAPGMLTNEGISPNELGLSWQPVLHGQRSQRSHLQKLQHLHRVVLHPITATSSRSSHTGNITARHTQVKVLQRPQR